MTSTDGRHDERLVIKADASGPRSARMVLQNPMSNSAVMEVARGGILRGLATTATTSPVTKRRAPDRLGMRGVDTPRTTTRGRQAVIVEAVPATDLPCSTPTTRSCAACAPAAGRSSGIRSSRLAAERAGVHRGACRGGRALVPRADRPGRHDRHPGWRAVDATSPGPSTCCRRPSVGPRCSTSPTPWPRRGGVRLRRACMPRSGRLRDLHDELLPPGRMNQINVRGVEASSTTDANAPGNGGALVVKSTATRP